MAYNPTTFLNYNYPDATGNGNYITTYYDDAWGGYNGWKGSLCLTENTDGSLTFWSWHNDWQDTRFYSEWAAYTFYALNNNGSLDKSVSGGKQVLSVSNLGRPPSGYQMYSYIEQDLLQYTSGTCVSCHYDFVAIYDPEFGKTFNVFRARLWPTGGPGTIIHLANLCHWFNGIASEGNHAFNDAQGTGGSNNNLTLKGKYVPPVPTLTAVTPATANNGQTITLTGTNITADYTPYFTPAGQAQSFAYPGASKALLSATEMTLVVPPSLAAGAYTIVLSNGTDTSNSVAFTLVHTVLSSGYSNEVAVTFPSAVVGGPGPQPVSVGVQPATTTITEGQSQQFRAIVTYTDGSTKDLTGDPSITWSLTNVDGVGTIDPASGLFVAVTTGQEVDVKAALSAPALTGAAKVVIAQRPPAPQLVSISVSPTPEIQINTSTQMHATGTSQLNTVMYPPVTWSVKSGTGNGTIDAYGMFTGTAVGTCTIIATAQDGSNISGSVVAEVLAAPVVNKPPVDDSFQVVPKSITLPAGSQLQFVAQATDQYNQPFYGEYTNTYPNLVPDADLTSAANWVDVNTNGKLALQNGAFVYTGTGSASGWIWRASNAFNVTPGVQYVLVADMDARNVIAGSIKWLVMDPTYSTQYKEIDSVLGADETITSAPFTLPAGVTQVTVLADTGNATVANGLTASWSRPMLIALNTTTTGTVEPPVTWSIQNFAGAGSLDTNGLFTAEIAGSQISVTATMIDGSGTTASAQVVVIPGPIRSIKVTPASTILQTNQSQQFTAQGIDAWGNVQTLSNVTWTVVGGIGTITQAGLFTATTAGAGKVLATQNGITGSASANVLAVVGGVVYKTTPQQPFARIRIRDTVASPLVVDARQRGGGLNAATAPPSTDDFWWDITTYDGRAFQHFGVFAAFTGLGTVPIDSSKALILETLGKYAAPQFLPLVVPGSTVVN